MSNPPFVCRAVPPDGWRVWNRRTRRWWGNPFPNYPYDLVEELNGPRRPERLVAMCRPGFPFRNARPPGPHP